MGFFLVPFLITYRVSSRGKSSVFVTVEGSPMWQSGHVGNLFLRRAQGSTDGKGRTYTHTGATSKKLIFAILALV